MFTMINKCGCNPIQEPFEYSIEENLENIIEVKFKKLFPIEIDIEKLKTKLICDFDQILNELECGLHPDLESFLEELSQIYMKNIFSDNTIYIPPVNYIGFGDENINDLNLNSLIKRHQENLRMTETVENKIYGSHLWVVSPYILHKVATDSDFNYNVTMNLVATINGIHYYRSNSKVDICKLTYYIK